MAATLEITRAACRYYMLAAIQAAENSDAQLYAVLKDEYRYWLDRRDYHLYWHEQE